MVACEIFYSFRLQERCVVIFSTVHVYVSKLCSYITEYKIIYVLFAYSGKKIVFQILSILSMFA